MKAEQTRKPAGKPAKRIVAPAQAGGFDATNPAHYRAHPSGVECITVTEHLGFCLGNAVKYIWRSGEAGRTVEDLKKARWYIDREIERLERPIPYRLVDGGAK